MKSLRTTALLLPLLAASAVAQDAIPFTIDASASQFTFAGNTTLGPIVGNPNTFGLSGGALVRVTKGTTQPVESVRFVNGLGAVVMPDIMATIPNPLPFLPPLASVTITGMVLTLRSDVAFVDASGNFTANVTTTALSGLTTVVPLTGAPTTTDLTGSESLPTTVVGSISVVGTTTRIEAPLSTGFSFTDAASGISANVTLTGLVAADYDGPAPTNYCTAAVNSTGVAGVCGTTGSTSLFAADLGLTATSLPQNSLGYFLFSETQGFVAGFGGSQGNLCIGGSIFRLSNFIQNSGAAGQVALSFPFAGLPPGADVDPGESWNFQYWFRDVSGGAATSNTTDGVNLIFVP